MESDERFKHVSFDPKFKPLRKKRRKVEIDERFAGMFNDERFTLKYTLDKRGKKIKEKTGDNLKKYYALDKNKKVSKKLAKAKEKPIKKLDKKPVEVTFEASNDNDDDDNDDEETEIDEQDEEFIESEPDISSSSDEAESETEDEIADIRFDWQPLDHDAEKIDHPTSRLAVQNFDWSHLNASDIFTIIHSIRPPKRVSIYVSEFGKERLKREEAEGPAEIVDMPLVNEEEEEYKDLKEKVDSLNEITKKRIASNEFEDADHVESDDDELRERIRRYELNRLKYYYAVVEFDSVESAKLVYNELDGLEYEGSANELDLRYIPEDMKFDDADLKSRCETLPDLTVYKAPQFINTALQQTKVQFTWDQTDQNRKEKLQKSYTKSELEKDDLDVYLASTSDDEESLDDDIDDEKKLSGMDKYKMLLKNLEEEKKDEEGLQLEVDWESGLSGSDELVEEEDMSSKKSKKSKKQKKNKNKKLVEDCDESGGEDFSFDPEDKRFNAIYDSKLYNVDPSHPKFKKTKANEIIAERKRKLRVERL